MPFTNQCGVVIRRADGSFKQHFLETRFPLILTAENKELRFGTNAEFFPAEGIPMLHPKVIVIDLPTRFFRMLGATRSLDS